MTAEGKNTSDDAVLDVKDLSVVYDTPRGKLVAVNNVSVKVRRGEILGLVGESGCGKTTIGMAILNMVQPPGKTSSGSVHVGGTELTRMNESELRAIRWKKVSMIPQGAMNSLNPIMKIGKQIIDAINAHESVSDKRALKQRVKELLNRVRLPERTYNLFPHELSGGMKQRVCIAMAIALNPSLIIADEPTSALDVVVQRAVAQTLLDVKEQMDVSIILIGHDMGLQAQLVDRLAVMYAGNLVELSPVVSGFEKPLHPYTQLLIAAIPSLKGRKPLKVTAGLAHDPVHRPKGCIFQQRCPHLMPVCQEVEPQLEMVSNEHYVACHLYSNEASHE